MNPSDSAFYSATEGPDSGMSLCLTLHILSPAETKYVLGSFIINRRPSTFLLACTFCALCGLYDGTSGPDSSARIAV